LQDALEANEFRIIAETVKAAPTKQAAAKQLGISERTLRYKMAKMRERGFAPQRKIA
jgi:two-component system response regulator FlrC